MQCARPDGPRTASAVTIGLVDEEVLPYLERRFAADQVRARAASSSTLERSAPARLLSALARWIDGRTASAAAELVRHPDLERWLVHNIPQEGAALDAPQQSTQPLHIRRCAKALRK